MYVADDDFEQGSFYKPPVTVKLDAQQTKAESRRKNLSSRKRSQLHISDQVEVKGAMEQTHGIQSDRSVDKCTRVYLLYSCT